MTALAKLRSQVEHARQHGTMVVLTPDEAQAVLDEMVPEEEPGCPECNDDNALVMHGVCIRHGPVDAGR